VNALLVWLVAHAHFARIVAEYDMGIKNGNLFQPWRFAPSGGNLGKLQGLISVA
jgi:hypothetical protein